MRQYQVFARPPGAKPGNMQQLKPTGADVALVDTTPVKATVEFMRLNPFVLNVTVQTGQVTLSLVQFDQEAEAPNAFLFGREYSMN